MPMLQKILVPTDLSARSTQALRAAQDFALTFGATIDLLYVWSAPALVAPESVITGIGINEQPLLEWVKQSAGEQLAKFEAEAQRAGIAVHHSSCEAGDPATAIIERARRGKYDLLVLGTHGRTFLSHALLGSVAEKVVRRAPCPVLTVRTPD